MGNEFLVLILIDINNKKTSKNQLETTVRKKEKASTR